MVTHTLMTGISRVETKENNLSQVPTPVSTSTAAAVFWSSKGEINKPILITGGENQLINMFGEPRPSYGYGLYGAIKFARTSASIYVVRVVAGNYAYGSAVFGENFTSNTYTNSSFGVPVYTDAKNPDTSITWTIGSITRQNAMLFRRIGPGVEGNTIGVSITSENMQSSSTVLAGTAGNASDAVLASGQYRWKAVPVNNLGMAINAITPNASTVVINNPTTNLATITFPRIEAAVGYQLYRQSQASSDYFYYTYIPQVAVGLSTITFIDKGQYVADTTRILPTTDYIKTPLFRVNVFDVSVSTTNVIEYFDVTFAKSKDGFGQQQGFEEKINQLSQQIRVKRNDNFIPTAANTDATGKAIFYSTPVYTFTLGADGLSASSLPDSAYINGYQLFSNEEQYPIRMIIESGKTLATQNAIIDLANSRKDCIPFLDVPSDRQEASSAVDYRRNILNRNTDRAALYSGDLKVYDKYTSDNIWVPPSAHAAAIFAATDAAFSVWQAGAGILNAQLTDVQEVRYNYSKTQLSLLANAQINPIQNRSSVGIWLPEQLTLSAVLSATSFISVRRTIDMIELAVSSAFDYSLQQPNDDFLARQLITLVSQILEPIKLGRGINNYEIVSDSTNNGAAFLNNAQRNISIYIEPTLPARYIQVLMNITQQGVSFQEIIVNQ